MYIIMLLCQSSAGHTPSFTWSPGFIYRRNRQQDALEFCFIGEVEIEAVCHRIGTIYYYCSRVKDNLVRVQVYMEDPTVVTIAEYPSYPVSHHCRLLEATRLLICQVISVPFNYNNPWDPSDPLPVVYSVVYLWEVWMLCLKNVFDLWYRLLF